MFFNYFVIMGRFHDTMTVLDFDANPSESQPSCPRLLANSGQYMYFTALYLVLY